MAARVIPVLAILALARVAVANRKRTPLVRAHLALVNKGVGIEKKHPALVGRVLFSWF